MNEREKFITLKFDEGESRTMAILAPRLGANVISFDFQRTEWSHPVLVLEHVDCAAIVKNPTSYGIPILSPTPGRVGKNQDGEFWYKEKKYTITPTRHGFLRHCEWTPARVSESSTVLRTSVKPDNHNLCSKFHSSFRFEFDAELEITLGSSWLDLALQLKNTGEISQPLDVGFHPYLHKPLKCSVMIPANQLWELDCEKEKTPTGQCVPVSGRSDFRISRQLAPEEHWDHIFTDLIVDESRTHGHVIAWTEANEKIEYETGGAEHHRVRRCLTVNPQPKRGGIRHIQLYTPEGRSALSLEPLSCPPNALNLRAQGCANIDLCELLPGEVATFWMRVSLEIEALV